MIKRFSWFWGSQIAGCHWSIPLPSQGKAWQSRWQETPAELWKANSLLPNVYKNCYKLLLKTDTRCYWELSKIFLTTHVVGTSRVEPWLINPPHPPPPDSFVLLGCFLICSWFWNDFCLIYLYWKKYMRRNRTVTDQLVDTHWILMIVTNLIKCRQFLLMAVWGFPEVNKTCFSKNVNSLTNWADRLDRQRLDMKMFSFSFFWTS